LFNFVLNVYGTNTLDSKSSGDYLVEIDDINTIPATLIVSDTKGEMYISLWGDLIAMVKSISNYETYFYPVTYELSLRP
jgi:hypothetical protein